MNIEPFGPLAGIRVLDLGTVIAGPFTATMLGDFGAEVIKVEMPGIGDTVRRLGPVDEEGRSYWWAADGRNKQSITLDLRKEEGRDLLLRLVDVSDVLVENFVPGTMARWGIGAGVLQARNPRLVVAHASGYGQTGPLSGQPGYDRVGVAFSGLWHLTGEPGCEPMRPGLSLADYMTGLFAAFGVMLALYHRDARGGAAQEVDAALYESMLRAMEFTISHYAATGIVRERTGNVGPAVPSGAFETKDGVWLALTVAQDDQYGRLMRAIGEDDLAGRPEYRDMRGRLADREPIEAALRSWIEARPAAEVISRLREAEIVVGASRTVAEVFADPHVAARGILPEVDDPVFGRIRIQGVTPRLTATPGQVARPAPLLGEHNEAIYGGLLGLAAAEIASLRERGII